MKGKEKVQSSTSASKTSPPTGNEDIVDVEQPVGIPELQPRSEPVIVKKSTTFVDLFKGNRDPDQGMILKYYDVGEGVMNIPNSVVKPIEDIWGFCLVGCCTGRFPGLKVVDAIVQSWNVPCRIIPHWKGWVILKFENEADRLDVLGRDIPKAYGKEFRHKIPGHIFMFDFAEFTTLPVWIQLHNVPMHLWSKEGIGMLASKVGKPLCTDLCTKQLGKGGFRRVLVEVDFSKEPVTKFEVTTLGKSFVQTVEFEEEPKYCFRRKTRNHGALKCRALEYGKPKVGGSVDMSVVDLDVVANPPGGHIEPPGGNIASSSGARKPTGVGVDDPLGWKNKKKKVTSRGGGDAGNILVNRKEGKSSGPPPS